LTLQNRKLKTILSTATPQGQLETLQPGERVQPAKLQTLDGSTAELRCDDLHKKYLLFVLSTTCPHCEKNLAIWRSIAEKSREDNLTIIGVSIHNLDQTTKYVTEKKPNFYIVVADTGFARRYKIVGVPETILIDGKATVERIWLGELTAADTIEMRRLTAAGKLIN